jgi:hypothetical protein
MRVLNTNTTFRTDLTALNYKGSFKILMADLEASCGVENRC